MYPGLTLKEREDKQKNVSYTHTSWIKRKHILSNPFMKRVREYDEDDDEKKHSWVSERETQV